MESIQLSINDVFIYAYYDTLIYFLHIHLFTVCFVDDLGVDGQSLNAVISTSKVPQGTGWQWSSGDVRRGTGGNA